MAYTYLALDSEGTPRAAFSLKHELERWVRTEINVWNGYYRPKLNLFRIRSAPWEPNSHVVELEFKDDALIEKA